MPMSAVVIVADDLGMSEAVNRGIMQAFDRGLVTVASLMTNMPAFDDAVRGADDRGLRDRLGVHLNLTEGVPLSPELRRCERFCSPEGRLVWTHRNVWRLEESEQRALAAEFRAQVQRARDAGIRLSHLDSHHHVHTAWAIGGIAIAVAREFDIPHVRLSRNCGPNPGPARLAYKYLFNRRVHGAGLAHVRYFGSVRDVSSTVQGGRGPVEVMTHPTLDADESLLDRGVGPLADGIGELNLGMRKAVFRDLLVEHRS